MKRIHIIITTDNIQSFLDDLFISSGGLFGNPEAFREGEQVANCIRKDAPADCTCITVGGTNHLRISIDPQYESYFPQDNLGKDKKMAYPKEKTTTDIMEFSHVRDDSYFKKVSTWEPTGKLDKDGLPELKEVKTDVLVERFTDVYVKTGEKTVDPYPNRDAWPISHSYIDPDTGLTIDAVLNFGGWGGC